MTILNCAATTCIYNEKMLCSRGEIEVMGEQARQSRETCCGSFRDRETADITDSSSEHCGCERIQIDCKARQCTYNDQCRCTAAAIDIEGSNACQCQDTACGTFDCKNC